ncbi:beta-amylase 7-like isoform X2 [Cucurbita pepo subsp. pepo]|uniref:beta-amylase 7-like isoform X2 n=1 Tax=Cucurbita pepo subsp. pepo TaxID=3664 RepID=UPI000C9D6E76|nr:beta-amylase 7-like isoform X2 [Cucurbita pepo subsp. pepo]
MCEEISWFQALETCVPSAGAGRACAMKIKRDVLKCTFSCQLCREVQAHSGSGTSEEDDDEDVEMDVKEEDGEEDDGERRIRTSLIVGDDGGMVSSGSNNNQFEQHHVQEQLGTPGGGRRCRPLEEKERTKLRERHRRAITARILAGLRRHGNYNLRVRADINDVIAALATEAGWVVLPDGTTFPSRSQVPKPANGGSAAVASSSSHMASRQTPPSSTRGVGCGSKSLPENNACRMKGVFMPNSPPYDASPNARCQSSSLVGDAGEQSASHPLISSSVDVVDGMQIVEMTPKLPERDFAGSAYIPVYVMLPLGVINMKCELVDPDGLLKQLRLLKSVNIDGVMVDCWWGIVEAHSPQEYNWNGYRRLFQMVHELKLKLQVVLSFHECGGNVGDDVCIPLPHWVAEIGRSNPDIFFTDREGRRNPECLSWGVDKERVLKGRTGLEVYFDYMRSFRVEFNDFFEDGVITTIEVGLGPCGELRFPSCPVKHGWRYPGIGEFQCYDQYLLKYLRKAAEARGHSFWARGPDNAGSYSSRPHETGFFCDGGDYDGYYGRFFLNWYSQVLVDHGDLVLYLAKLAFEGTHIVAKVGIHWWYKTASHAAELTAGFYNPCNRDGYAAIMAMLKKHSASLNFTSAGFHMLDQQENIANTSSDPEAVVWQVTYAARDVGVEVVSENALPFLDRVGYNKILDNAKPLDDPDGRYLSSFIYNKLTPLLLERHNLVEFERFVKRMHGESVHDLQV